MNLLLLHGFTSHPVLTLGPLPQVLREAGFQVSQPALPGHGTRPEDLLKVGWQDWLETARAFYRELPEPRGVVGLSMGALLSAHLAAETPTQALVIEAGRDKVVDPAGVRRYHALLGSSRKEYLVFPESGHDLLLDRDREAVALAVRDWLIANSTYLH